MKDRERIETSRLILRRPLADDASAMFEPYASDSEVTRFVGWPRHLTVADTIAFLRFSDAAWDRWPGGPYLIVSRVDGRLLGSTGLGFEAPDRFNATVERFFRTPFLKKDRINDTLKSSEKLRASLEQSLRCAGGRARGLTLNEADAPIVLGDHVDAARDSFGLFGVIGKLLHADARNR